MSDSAIAWTTAHQTTLSFTISWSLPKFMSIASVMPFNHLILSRSLLLPPSIFPSIRIFSNESVLHIRWPKYWSFSFNISPSSEYSGLISFRIDWFSWWEWAKRSWMVTPNPRLDFHETKRCTENSKGLISLFLISQHLDSPICCISLNASSSIFF